MSLCALTGNSVEAGRGVGAAPGGGPTSERRRARRRPFAYRFLLTPLDSGKPPEHPIYVVTRDLSASGLGFAHADPIAARKVRLTAADDGLAELGMFELEIEVLLQWCRFVKPGVYESGGRVSRTTAPLF